MLLQLPALLHEETYTHHLDAAHQHDKCFTPHAVVISISAACRARQNEPEATAGWVYT